MRASAEGPANLYPYIPDLIVESPGQRKPSKKFSRQCRGCNLWWEPDKMATGSSFDHACKNRVDNVRKIAKSQNKMAWFHEVHANDVKLQQVLSEYGNRAATPRQPRKITLQVLESVTATTAVIVEEIGEMMTKKQYCSWAESVAGGKLTEWEAEQQWAEWVAQVNEPQSAWPPRDIKGKGNEQRIW
eukprot:7511427-Pyramimonas_sp.AAC.1